MIVNHALAETLSYAIYGTTKEENPTGHQRLLHATQHINCKTCKHNDGIQALGFCDTSPHRLYCTRLQQWRPVTFFCSDWSLR